MKFDHLSQSQEYYRQFYSPSPVLLLQLLNLRLKWYQEKRHFYTISACTLKENIRYVQI